MARTNVEISPHRLAKLRAIAARRGDKGYAKVLGDAIDAFAAAEALDRKSREEAIAAKGALTEEQGERILARIKEGRKQSWRSSRTRTS